MFSNDQYPAFSDGFINDTIALPAYGIFNS